MKKKTASSAQMPRPTNKKTRRVLQSDVPSYSLDEALRVLRALADNYAFHPTKPLGVAHAMGIQPTSSNFRMLTGAAIAYGLTEGGYAAPDIRATPLGRRILRPTEEGADLAARREAMLRPRVIREFLSRYDNARVPRNEIAHNVLIEMGVPDDSVERVFILIMESARKVGFVRSLNESEWIDLQGTPVTLGNIEESSGEQKKIENEPPDLSERAKKPVAEIQRPAASPSHLSRSKRVFVAHGKSTAILGHLKQLLEFGGFEAVVSIERGTVSKPVPDKVLDDMRECAAAILHVDPERELFTKEGEVETVLNPNVLIEIGVALGLYGRRFILLTKDGVQLPSNLHGLYEVRYQGDHLDGQATLKLLKAFNDFKNYEHIYVEKLGPEANA